MKWILQITAFIFSIQLGICQKNPIEINFLKSEWISDSISVEDGEQWREFLFFDSIGNFTRTTWWNENYVLDKGKLVEEKIKSVKGKDYLIEIVDSTNIILRKSGYEGFFYRDPWEEIGTFERNVNRFILGDSIKKEILGEWIFDTIRYELSDAYEGYDFIPDFVEIPLGEIPGGIKLDKGLVIKFTNDNLFLCEETNGKVTKYRYTIDDKGIDLAISDMVIGIEIEGLNNNEVTLIRKRLDAKSYLKFRRK